MDVFSAVKHGDMTRVVYLVEEQAAPLQQRDMFDATPLYYASFTGNLEMIEYLLAKGAKCERKTFDGERCLYAALNARVRNVLLEKGFKRAGARQHDLYLEFLEKLFNNANACTDIEFAFGAECIRAHCFVLAARCPLLGQLICKQWKGQRLVSNLGQLDSPSLKALIKWCYTCRLEVPVSASKSCQQLLQKLELHSLAQQFAEDDTKLTGEETAVVVIEPERDVAKAELQDAMDQAAARVCGSDAISEDLATWHDCVLQAAGNKFLAHRAVLYGRSELFSVMLQNPNFREGQAIQSRESISLQDMEPAALQTVLRWMYSDRVKASLPPDHLLEVMRFADRLMCEGLKQKCGVLLQPYVTPSTALSLLEEATRMDAERLVDACLRVVAQQLPQLACEPLLADLVRESAAGVANREDVDSVPLVDDLRYHIAQLYGDGELSDDDSDWDEEGDIVCSGLPQDVELLSERKQRLFVLQDLLANLGIEA